MKVLLEKVRDCSEHGTSTLLCDGQLIVLKIVLSKYCQNPLSRQNFRALRAYRVIERRNNATTGKENLNRWKISVHVPKQSFLTPTKPQTNKSKQPHLADNIKKHVLILMLEYVIHSCPRSGVLLGNRKICQERFRQFIPKQH